MRKFCLFLISTIMMITIIFTFTGCTNDNKYKMIYTAQFNISNEDYGIRDKEVKNAIAAEKEVQDMVSDLFNDIKNYFTEQYDISISKSVPEIKTCKLNGGVAAAFYKNNIYVNQELATDKYYVSHEIIHYLASNDSDGVLSGFMFKDELNNIEGLGLTEGYTHYLTKEYCAARSIKIPDSHLDNKSGYPYNDLGNFSAIYSKVYPEMISDYFNSNPYDLAENLYIKIKSVAEIPENVDFKKAFYTTQDALLGAMTGDIEITNDLYTFISMSCIEMSAVSLKSADLSMEEKEAIYTEYFKFRDSKAKDIYKIIF